MIHASSPTAATTAATSSAFSGACVVEASPVVPLSTRPSWPVATRCRASWTAAPTSIAPSAVNGVTIAVSTAPNGRAGVAVRGMGSRYRDG